MLRRGLAVLTAAVCLVVVAASGAAAYTPQPGARFNLPRGTQAERLRILSHINGSIDSSPAGSTIRFAVYSFDREDTADSLIAAYQRGVHVQVLLNDNWTSDQTRRLQSVIGTDRAAPSFVYICYRSCRGPRGNLHSKFYLFTQAGSASNVVMFGSANPTSHGAVDQWNDLFTVTGPAMHALYDQVFEQMVPDVAVPVPYIVQQVGDLENRFSPHPDTTTTNDPVMRRLRGVGCTATGGTGLDGHTVIRITAYGWVGDRGRYLAEKVSALRRNGCYIRVLVASTGSRIVSQLRASGVKVRRLAVDLNGDGDVDVYNHMKTMIVSGRYDGVSSWHVWTGSENWSGIALNNDEVVVHIPRKAAYGRYADEFNRLWPKGH